jgi:hypothetical protein
MVRRVTLILWALAVALGIPTSLAQSSFDSGVWTPLGVAGLGHVQAVAVSPSYPQDGTLVALRPGNTDSPFQRSRDAGATWEALPSPPFSPGRLGFFGFGPRDGSSPVLFLLQYGGRPADPRDWSLYRSDNLGTSWQAGIVAPPIPERATYRNWPPDANAQLQISPAFAQDGIVLLIGSGTLYLSQDWGATWTEVPMNGRVNDVRFSPDFGRDGTLFAAVVGDDPRSTEDHPGVLRSSDRGGSWTPMPQGLEADGLSYRYVHHLTISPTFAEDHTLFAVASVPSADAQCLNVGPGVRRRLTVFRSLDAAASWQSVRSLGNACGDGVTIAMSPSFADDGVVLLSSTPGTGGPSSVTCTVLRSDSRGDAWTGIRDSPAQGSCVGPLFYGDRITSIVLSSRSRSLTWSLSADGGLTWAQFSPPATRLSPVSQLAIAASPTFGRDHTVFMGELDDLWRYAPMSSAH